MGPFSKDKICLNPCSENIKAFFLNTWASSDWRRIINHVLRFREEIGKTCCLDDLSNAINKFKCNKLNIPKEILKSRDNTNDYVDNLRQ